MNINLCPFADLRVMEGMVQILEAKVTLAAQIRIHFCFQNRTNSSY